MSKLTPVILSGGAGSRLWPLSRDLYPKQLISLLGEASLLQDTVRRAAAATDGTPPVLVCNEEHRFMVAEQLRETGTTPAAILLEPVGRNTAPAIAAAASEALAREGEDAKLLILPADHVIRDVDRFTATVRRATALAESGEHVTFGVVPTRAETGFGYIEAGAPLPIDGGRRVRAFVEKPERAVAEQFLISGHHYWNSGMFVFSARRFLTDLERFEPQMVRCATAAVRDSSRDLDFIRLERESFCQAPSSSVDYALMERIDDAAVVPLDAEWDDVGSWSALWSLGERDVDDNVTAGDVLTHDSHACYLRAEHRLLATVGVNDLVIIETADAVMVAAKDAVQDVKGIVEQLKAQGREEHMIHPRVFRPWGSYERIARGERYEVKRLVIRPGASQSTQMHHHRAEHWVVVKGTALVSRAETEYLLTENESAFIPLGDVHQVANPGKVDLEMIEVRSGAYLGEDDIVRLERP